MMIRKRLATLLVVAVAVAALVLPSTALAGPTMESVGKRLFFDKNLSTPRGQSCASCHAKSSGFADAGKAFSPGVVSGRFGNRNAPMAAYAKFAPDFGWNAEEEMYMGGQFWDGRAKDLEAQAKGPFLNPLEMNNPSETAVVTKVINSCYASDFRAVFGSKGLSLSNVDLAYDNIAKAIAAYERTKEFAPFDSKYDVFLGKVLAAKTGAQRSAAMSTLTKQERRGLYLFNGKAGCSACHPSGAELPDGPTGVAVVTDPKPLFTDYSYDNIGFSKNWSSKFLYLPSWLNPAGSGYIDLGLFEVTGNADNMGQFKVMSLRNIALTAPYGHASQKATLKDWVVYYNTATAMDANGTNVPEVPEGVNRSELGDLGLTDQDVNDVVAFLKTLSDKTYLDAGSGCGM